MVTAAAGTGIGWPPRAAASKRAPTSCVSDSHERRLGETADELAERYGDRGRRDRLRRHRRGAGAAARSTRAVERFGRIDVMVNNAGLGGTASVLDMTDEQWSRVLDVTLNGTFRCTRAALRPMVAGGVRRRGRQQRLGARLARPTGPGALRGGQGRRDGADPLHGARRRRARHPGQRGRAEPGHAPVLAKVTSEELLGD